MKRTLSKSVHVPQSLRSFFLNHFPDKIKIDCIVDSIIMITCFTGKGVTSISCFVVSVLQNQIIVNFMFILNGINVYR